MRKYQGNIRIENIIWMVLCNSTCIKNVINEMRKQIGSHQKAKAWLVVNDWFTQSTHVDFLKRGLWLKCLPYRAHRW